MSALYSHTTRATGTTLTAAIYNADHENHITNGIPAQLDDYSASVAQMQSMTDPGGVGSESQATSLAGELERLRFVIDRMVGGAQWYSTPASNLAGGGTITAVSSNTTLTASNIGQLINITDAAAVTVPATGAIEIGDRIKFKNSTTKAVTLEVQGSDTIDGLTQYRIPAYTNCEIAKTGVNTYTFTQKPDDDVGVVKEYGGATAPLGWTLSDENTLSRTDYGNLFAVYSTTFGAGDGSTTFGKPNRQRRVAVGAGGTGTATLANTVGATGGAETHTLTQAETPVKNHAHTASGTVPSVDNSAPGDGPALSLADAPAQGTTAATVTVNAAGDATASAHNIMQSSIVMNFIIKL